MQEERVYMPGEVVVDPENAAVLMRRDFIIPVPDNFVPPPPEPPVDYGYHPTPPMVPVDEDKPLTLEDLMGLTRKELNQLATEAGVDSPDAMLNKQAVAEALLAKATAEEAAEPEGEEQP
jgi:hypothetical protein